MFWDKKGKIMFKENAGATPSQEETPEGENLNKEGEINPAEEPEEKPDGIEEKKGIIGELKKKIAGVKEERAKVKKGKKEEKEIQEGEKILEKEEREKEREETNKKIDKLIEIMSMEIDGGGYTRKDFRAMVRLAEDHHCSARHARNKLIDLEEKAMDVFPKKIGKLEHPNYIDEIDDRNRLKSNYADLLKRLTRDIEYLDTLDEEK